MNEEDGAAEKKTKRGIPPTYPPLFFTASTSSYYGTSISVQLRLPRFEGKREKRKREGQGGGRMLGLSLMSLCPFWVL